LASLVVAAAWFRRSLGGPPATPSTLEATVALVITPHDAFGVPARPIRVKDRGAVRAVLEALGVDGQPAIRCPPDYATAEVGILLTGSDVYAKKNVYVWGLSSRAPSMVVVSSTGCRGGPPADPGALAREVASAAQRVPGEVWSALPDASRRAEGEPQR
jgi:hypothetical protein